MNGQTYLGDPVGEASLREAHRQLTHMEDAYLECDEEVPVWLSAARQTVLDRLEAETNE